MDIVVVVLSFCGTLFGGYLYSYFKKKGEHLATKEDIEEITRKIEKVKTELGQRLRINSFRYEKEYAVLSELCEAVFRYRDLARDIDQIVSDKKWRREHDGMPSEFSKRYTEATDRLYGIAERNRPFFPEAIYALVVELDARAKACAVYSGLVAVAPPHRTEEFFYKAESFAAEIQEKTEQIIESIRLRVVGWEQ